MGRARDINFKFGVIGGLKHTFVGAGVMLSSLSGRPAKIINPKEILGRMVTGRRGRRPLHYTFRHPAKHQFEVLTNHDKKAPVANGTYRCGGVIHCIVCQRLSTSGISSEISVSFFHTNASTSGVG